MNQFNITLSDNSDTLTLEEGEKERLDIVLAQLLPELSRSRVKQLCQDGHAKVNGTVRKASFKVKKGDTLALEIIPSAMEQVEITPENIPLDVLFEDDDLILINKQPGLVVHPGAGIYSGTLVNALAYHFKTLSTRGGELRPGIVHRLDKGTSGLILVAKTDFAHHKMTEQWMANGVTKVYQALVWGKPDPPSGEVISHIGRHPKDRKRMTAEVEGGKRAHSRYKVIETFPEAAKVNVHILTGRTHQIRVHMKHLGYPVVGDALYGGNRHKHLNKAFEAMPDYPMLHAALLRFTDPKTQEQLTFKVDPPKGFLECEKALRVWPA
ncbi:MAG: RNA pseudouridine synthase [Acidobacteria bacterium]|nr:MAG: RNA pseudouridine synthase [Acidobacteriota bacterium]